MYDYLSYQPLLKACKHDHAHAHHHVDVRAMDKKVLTISLTMIAPMMFVQFIYALLSNSLALLSDTLHIFPNVFALALSPFALIAVQKWQNEQEIFGYFRLGALIAFVNALSIILSAIFITYEDIYKFFYPEEIDTKTMIIIAFSGLLVSALSAFLMFKNADLDDLNVKSTFCHMMNGLLDSVVAMVGRVAVCLSGIFYIDSLLALILAFLLLCWTVILLEQSANILPESSPADIDVVKAMILEDERVEEVFDLHITQITNEMLVATMHIKTLLVGLDGFELLSQDLTKNLLEKFHIGHSII